MTPDDHGTQASDRDDRFGDGALARLIDAISARLPDDPKDDLAAMLADLRARLNDFAGRTAASMPAPDRRDDATGPDPANDPEAPTGEGLALATLKTALDTLNEGFAYFDADDRLVHWNAKFLRGLPDVRHGLRPGLSFDDYVRLKSQSERLVIPEGLDRERWIRRRLQWHRDRSANFNQELTGDRWSQVAERRLPDGATVVLVTDVTDLVRAERRQAGRMLDDQARTMRAAIEALVQGIAIFDPDGALSLWNKRLGELLDLPPSHLGRGAPAERLLGWMRDRFTFSQLQPDRLAAWIARGKGRRPLTFELRLGADRTLDLGLRELPGGGFVLAVTDVTAEREANRALFEVNELLEQRVTERTAELREAVARAERANASKNRFITAASHDLLQPLSAGRLFLSTLSSDDNPPEVRATVARAMNALDNTEGMIEALLDISRLESDAILFARAPVDLHDLMTDLCEEFQPLADQDNIDLRCVFSSARVVSDRIYLRRILQNLMANAIRYTASGRVLLGARRLENAVRVEVWDTGPGIAKADRERIFHEFERLENPGNTAGGLGLGLAIVRRIAERLGHPLDLVSVPGRGSGFRLTLPLVGAPEPARAEFAQGPGMATTGTVTKARERLNGQGRIVLLVDPDPVVGRYVADLLESWDVAVLEAADAEGAVSLLDDIRIVPDAMLIAVPSSGHSAAAAIERLCATAPGVPTRLMTDDLPEPLAALCRDRDISAIPARPDAEPLARFMLEALDAGL